MMIFLQANALDFQQTLYDLPPRPRAWRDGAF